jgi:glucokinase
MEQGRAQYKSKRVAAIVALIVDHIEDIATHLPMISRILHLLVIDILAVRVAMRRNPDSIAALSGAEDDGAKRARGAATPGVSTASPLSRLTSHSR